MKRPSLYKQLNKLFSMILGQLPRIIEVIQTLSLLYFLKDFPSSNGIFHGHSLTAKDHGEKGHLVMLCVDHCWKYLWYVGSIYGKEDVVKTCNSLISGGLKKIVKFWENEILAGWHCLKKKYKTSIINSFAFYICCARDSQTSYLHKASNHINRDVNGPDSPICHMLKIGFGSLFRLWQVNGFGSVSYFRTHDLNGPKYFGFNTWTYYPTYYLNF